MQTSSRRLLRTTGAIAAASLTISAARLFAAPAATDAFPAFDSYLKVSGERAWIHGNGAAYRSRAQAPENGGGGIEDFHYARDLNKTTTLTLDGRALAGVEDYLVRLNLAKAEFGSLDVGYQNFRTFYDGFGGFFPLNNAWAPLSSVAPAVGDELFVDRGKFWTELKFQREDGPEITLRYTNETRSGRKDSTIWGDTDDTGIDYGVLNGGLAGNNGNASVRKNIPSYLELDERHQMIEGTIKHTVGNTTAHVTVLGDWATLDNTRYMSRFPGEARLPNAAGTGVAPANGTSSDNWTRFNNQVVTTHADTRDSDTKGLVAGTITEFNDRVTLRLGATLHHLQSTFGGDRVLVTAQPINGDPTRDITTYQIRDLVGRGDVHTAACNAGLDLKPFEHLSASFGVRAEDREAESDGRFDVVTSTTGATPVATTTPRFERSRTDETSFAESLDLRYTRIKDLTLFSGVTHKRGTGDEILTPPYNDDTVVLPNVFFNDIDEVETTYSVGASWKASSALTLRAEPFYKTSDYHSTGLNTNSSNTATPAVPTRGNNYELESRAWGVKATAILKPHATLTFTTRYVWQRGERSVAGYLPSYPEYDAMESTTHNVSETIDWNPLKQFYVQLGGNVVRNRVATAYLHDLDTATSGVIPAGRFLRPADSDYMVFHAVVGAVITKRDDLQLRYTEYRADNYDPDIALYSQPYGASATERTIIVGLDHRFSDRLVGGIKLGYMDGENRGAGGNADFRGPLGYMSLTYGL